MDLPKQATIKLKLKNVKIIPQLQKNVDDI